MPREPIEERAEISRVVREASLLTHPVSRARILRHHRAELVPEQIEVGITADRYVCHRTRWLFALALQTRSI